MLIVLRDGPHLELGRTQAGVHTEIPTGIQPVSHKVGEASPWGNVTAHAASFAPLRGRERHR